MEFRIRLAEDRDRDGISSLLKAADLPVPSADDPPVQFLVAARGGRIVGIDGWETYGTEALLRSVVVESAERGRGTGRRLVEEALERIAAAGCSRVTLITLDASAFFARFGFRPLERTEVAGAVQASPEYHLHACRGGEWLARKVP